MFSTRSIRIVSYVVMAYILVAISWWAVLLHREHQDLYDAYAVIQREQVKSSDTKIEEIRQMTPEELHQKRHRKSVMILSEAIFIGLGLIIGLWVIHYGFMNQVKAEKVKQNFLLAISHELKSPIASAQLALESLLRFNTENPKTKEIAQQGLKETNRLHNLVKNILLATKLDAGYLPDYQTFRLLPCLENLRSSLLVQYPNRDIRIEVDPKLDQINLDKQAFEIICQNLMENALKYGDEASPISIQVNRADHRIDIEVADFGSGIPINEREHVFKRFYRIGDESRRKSKGTGLGLYIVHELVVRNNGTIKIKSNQPTGTIVVINWPIDEKTKQ